MRDSTIQNMHQANAHRDALIMEQFEFLQLRQEAFERVIKVSRPLDRIKWFFWPAEFMKVVDAVQLSLLAQRREQLKQVVAQAAVKSKITIVGAGAAVGMKI